LLETDGLSRLAQGGGWPPKIKGEIIQGGTHIDLVTFVVDGDGEMMGSTAFDFVIRTTTTCYEDANRMRGSNWQGMVLAPRADGVRKCCDDAWLGTGWVCGVCGGPNVCVEVQTLYFERFHGYYWDYFLVVLSDTVDSLKAQIRDRWHVPSDQQRLHLAGVELQDGHTLSDSNIQRWSRIHLTVPMRLFVRMISGKTIELDMDWYASVGNLIRKIEDKEGIPMNQQRLHLAGRLLLRCDWKLSDLQIQSGSTLDLVVTPPPWDF